MIRRKTQKRRINFTISSLEKDIEGIEVNLLGKVGKNK